MTYIQFSLSTSHLMLCSLDHFIKKYIFIANPIIAITKNRKFWYNIIVGKTNNGTTVSPSARLRKNPDQSFPILYHA